MKLNLWANPYAQPLAQMWRQSFEQVMMKIPGHGCSSSGCKWDYGLRDPEHCFFLFSSLSILSIRGALMEVQHYWFSAFQEKMKSRVCSSRQSKLNTHWMSKKVVMKIPHGRSKHLKVLNVKFDFRYFWCMCLWHVHDMSNKLSHFWLG